MTLKRYTPLKRSKPLLRKVSKVSSENTSRFLREETRKPIAKVSEKTAVKNKIYYHIREIFLQMFSVCKAQLPGCSRVATDIHHRKGRGKYMLIIKYFLPVCRKCHDRIGEKSTEAIALGLSVSRNRIENSYLQPHDSITIVVLLKCGGISIVTN